MIDIDLALGAPLLQQLFVFVSAGEGEAYGCHI